MKLEIIFILLDHRCLRQNYTYMYITTNNPVAIISNADFMSVICKEV